MLAFLVVLGVLTTGLYAMLRHGTATILDAEAAADPQARARRMSGLLLGVLLIGVLIIVFVIGAFLVLRAGRALTRQKLGGRDTEFRDIWSEARVTPQQMEAADEQLRDAQRPSDEGDRPA